MINPIHDLQMRRMVKSRTHLMLHSPFFSSLVLRLVLVSTEEIGTAATDGRYLWFNPLFVEQLSDGEVEFLIAHELAHCFLLHPMRRGSRDPRKANVAMDHVVNLMLNGCINPRFELIRRDVPPYFVGGLCMDQKYAGMYFEQVYSLLPDPPQMKASGGSGQQGNPVGGIGGVLEPQSGPDKGDKPMPKEQTQGLEEEWKIAATQAAQIAKAAGRLPGDLERYVNEALRSKVDWKEVLNRFVQCSLDPKDFTWVPPNRRFIGEDLYLPSIKREGIGPIDVHVDVSGSIGQKLLDQWAGELNEIVREAKPESVRVIYFDAQVQGEPEVFEPEQEVRLQVRGGGGTCLIPSFTWVEHSGVNPVCAIVLTDLYIAGYPEEPSYPVLFATPTRDAVGPWGETVLIEES